MSDLLVPFVLLYEDDGQAFMCFRALMARVRRNFFVQQQQMFSDMASVVEIIKQSDQELHSHMESIGCTDGLWAFRMLLVMLRRELSLEDAFAFWEVLWAGEGLAGHKSLMPNVVAALAVKHRSQILGFTESSQMQEFCSGVVLGKLEALGLIHHALMMVMAGRKPNRPWQHANPGQVTAKKQTGGGWFGRKNSTDQDSLSYQTVANQEEIPAAGWKVQAGLHKKPNPHATATAKPSTGLWRNRVKSGSLLPARAAW